MWKLKTTRIMINELRSAHKTIRIKKIMCQKTQMIQSMTVAKRMEPKIRIPIHRGKLKVSLKQERKKIIMRMYPPIRKIGHSK